MAAKESGSVGTAATRKALTGQKNAKHVSVVPMDGWNVQSPYGVLKTCNGVALVRLEDVHAWMMQRDSIPSASAAARVFGVFVSDASSELGIKHGAATLRSHLYITDLSDYADGLGSWTGRSYLEKVAEQVPYVLHHRLDRDTPEAVFYALGLLAGEAWAPQIRSVGFDDRMGGYSADSYFPTLEKSREILGHFAVSMGMAHELWGWGTVTAENTGDGVVKLRAVLNVSTDPKSWKELVSWRKKNDGHEWTTELKKILADERHKRGTERGAAKQMADELEMTVSRLNELIRTNKVGGKRQSKRAA